MDFAQVWDELEIGDRVAVSNGKPPPSTNTAGAPYKAWRSHNFTGAIAEKLETETEAGTYRSMKITMSCPVMAPDCENNEITWTIQEGIGHSFTLVE